ncbi:MAG: hypothetical protein ACREO8_00075 [Luteimonas sp.]
MIAGRRALRLGVALLVLLVLVSIALRVALQPARVSGVVLSSIGDAFGLQITASGHSDYTLRGTPTLVLRDVDVREPGSATAMLSAQRLLVSVPWSTVRSRGAQLDITHLELDAPLLDSVALQRWLASRPSAESRLPRLSDGLRISDGRIDGDGWRIDGLKLSLPRLAADRTVDAAIAGRLRTAALALNFDLDATATRPGNAAGVAVIGTLVADGGKAVDAGGWRVPARLRVAGRLHVDDAGIHIPKLRASLSGHYHAGNTQLPFAIALISPLRYRDSALRLTPASIALRGGGPVPDIDARGAVSYGNTLDVDIDGRLARWPDAWPALPAPLAVSPSPLSFSLNYAGKADFSDPLGLQLRRDATRFDARLHIDAVTAWTRRIDAGTPLPPLTGQLSSPRIDISGMQLEGVEIDFDDASAADAATVR